MKIPQYLRDGRCMSSCPPYQHLLAMEGMNEPQNLSIPAMTCWKLSPQIGGMGRRALSSVVVPIHIKRDNPWPYPGLASCNMTSNVPASTSGPLKNLRRGHMVKLFTMKIANVKIASAQHTHRHRCPLKKQAVTFYGQTKCFTVGSLTDRSATVHVGLHLEPLCSTFAEPREPPESVRL